MRRKEIGRTILANIPLQSDCLLKDLMQRRKPAPDMLAGRRGSAPRRRVPTSEVMKAVFGDDTERITGLMDEGADPNFTDCHGETPLMYACRTRRHRSAEALVEKGARINALSNEGWTPLMLAAESGDLPTVRLLVRRDANLNVQTPYGQTAKSIAWGNRNYRIALYLHRMEKALRNGNIGNPHSPLGREEATHGYSHMGMRQDRGFRRAHPF